MDLSWLTALFQQYDRREVEDLIATFFISVGFHPKTTPPVILGIIEAYAERAGVEQGEDRAASQQKIRAHLEAHPLNPELKLAFEHRLRATFALDDTGALEGAFARFADEHLPKRAPAKERPKGTRPGYLALLAHDDVDRS